MDNAELRTRIGVGHLMASYQYLADSGKTRQLSQLFAPDAVFTNNSGVFHGPDGVLEFFQSVKESFVNAGFLPGRHHLSSIYVDPRPDGSASTYACFQFVGIHGADHWGTYRDEVVEIDGTWKFRERTAWVEGYAPDSPVRHLLQLGE